MPPLKLQLFGTARVFIDGIEVTLGAPPRTLEFLAFIALARGPIARTAVASAMWPDENDGDSRSNVRRHLHALHRSLRAAGVPEEVVVSRHGRLHLSDTAAIEIDVLEFERFSASDATLRAARDLYAGDLLATYDSEWIASERERLRALQCENLRRAGDLARSSGDAKEALHCVDAALTFEPWNEDVARTAMMTHWEFGDRAGALRTFASFAERVSSDLGSVPSATLRQLYATIERGDVYGRLGNVPAELELSSFFGRADEIERLSRLCEERRVIVLVGPPGVGKTRLALRLASRHESAFPDGVWFVDLAPLAAGASVEAAVLGVLGAGAGGDGRSLREILAGKRLLLLIDNCEHLTREASEAIERISSSARDVLVIATSRTVLAVRGAATWSVAPLPVPGAAVDLFVERAGDANAARGRALEGSAAVVELCARLDGLPLAIELAAARLRSLSLEEVVARMAERFRLLTLDGEGAHRSGALRSTFDWSYSLLDHDERSFFRSLTTFRGGWTLAASAAIAGVDEWRAVDLLRRLVEKSLVVPPSPESTNARYDMLQSLREYARLSAGDDEVRMWRLRHAAYYASVWASPEGDAVSDAFSPERKDYTGFAREFDNVRAALDVLLAEGEDPATGVALVCAVGFYWVDSVPWKESRRWLEAAVESGSGSPLERVALHLLRSRLALRQGDAVEARAEAGRSVALARDLDDPANLAAALLARARAGWMATDLAATRADGEAALELCERAGHAYGRARALSTLYLAFISASEVDSALDAATRAAELYRSLDARIELAEALANMGTCAYYRSDVRQAAARYHEALALVRDSKNDRTIAFIAHNLASALWECDDAHGAWLNIADAIRLAMRIGYPAIVVRSVELVARWCVARDPYEAAVFSAAANAGSERYDARFQQVELEDHARLAAAIDVALPRGEALRARSEGATLSLGTVAERAIAYAKQRRVAVTSREAAR